MQFFGLKSCDTCRKAQKALATAGYPVEIIDVRADGIASDDLDRIVDTFGDAAINRASTTWRGLTDEERAHSTLELIRAHPTLMKRPVIHHKGSYTIGWKADVQAKYLGDGA